MGPCHHHASESGIRGLPVGCHIDNILHHGVIKKKSEHGTVLSAGETFPESVAIRAAYAGLAFEDSAEKIKFAIIRIAIHDLIVHALVDKVTIQMMQSSDGMYILEYPQSLFQFLNPSFQVFITHETFLLSFVDSLFLS
jgi:hypothetical protein